MPNLVGTGLNQVPTNSMLGGLAYQDPEHASIKDLDLKNLSQINSEIAATARDVFVYDTSKDSDGGAWRKRTQHTSWYNEPLNTATRGSRKEFPAVAVIVVKNIAPKSVTIYDGDDPDLPMWMVFSDRGNYSNMLFEANPACVAALNAKIACGSTGYDLNVVDFISDSGVSYSDSSTISGVFKHPISLRNTAPYSSPSDIWTFYTIPNIGDRSINDVAMTVLPNAPIDDATGLAVPTIAVAQSTMVSIIKDDGTVANLINFNPISTIHLESNTIVASISTGTIDYIYKTHIPSGTGNFTYTTDITAGSNNYYMNSNAGTIPLMRDIDVNSTAYDLKNDVTYRGGSGGFDTIMPGVNYSNTHSNIAIAYIAPTYNTGYMPGNNRGAFLSDTSTMNAGPDSEIVSNGDFGNGTTGWDTSVGSITETGGQLVASGESSWQTIGFTRNYNFIPGNVYYITWTMGGGSSSGIIDYSNNGTLSPTTGANYYYPGPGTYTIKYTPASATPSLRFVYSNTAANPGTLDNVSIIPAVQDRSVNNNGLQVTGTITKSPVATGADLVGYSGFSGSNYLENTSFGQSFGNPPTISIVLWQKITDISNYSYGVSFSSGNSVRGGISNGSSASTYPGQGYFNMGSTTQYTGVPINDGVWHCLVGTIDGNTKNFYLDGNLVQTNTITNHDMTAIDKIHVGTYGVSHAYPHRGSVALVRVSQSIPSAEQIRKMYEDEKVLFQENAKATLYGSSDVVTALAFDKDTELLHVGTSAGRSDFQGLRRINNTTTAVTTAISASNGLIAEQ